MSRSLIFCGDIHGELRSLVYILLNVHKIKHADIIILGDFGIFNYAETENTYNRVSNRLEESDIILYTIRGNHDNPIYFTNLEKYSFPRLKFLEDHKVYNIGGKSIYTIGGANSLDIESRLEYNEKQERNGSKKRVWWPEEDIIRVDENTLPKEVDIIISHSAPISFEPVCSKWDETPDYQYKKIIEEREYLDTILNKVSAKYWLYGHFHMPITGTYKDLMYKCLDITGLFEIPTEEN